MTKNLSHYDQFYELLLRSEILPSNKFVALSSKPCRLISPMGGFGNHLRWLILLDSSFKFTYKIQEQNYLHMAGEDWPTYQNYINNNWAGIDDHIKIEVIESTKHETLNFITIQDKISFIKSQIYNQTRTWSNWLKLEWAYRKDLDTLISADHNLNNDTKVDLKTLVTTVDPEIALKHVFKFNSNLNFIDPETFKNMIVEQMKKNNSIIGNVDFISVDVLYQPTLDYNFYQYLINYFELENQYNYANEIHQLWFRLHQTATDNFVKYVNSLYLLTK